MARVNIESELWSDPRFQDLMILVQNRHAAKGMVVEAVTLAQQYWLPNKLPIPTDVFERSGLKPLIEVGLAELREDGVYVRGSKDRFEWWFKGVAQRQEAGKHRAEKAQRDSSGRWTSTSEEPTEPSAIQPSSSSSSSSSSSLENTLLTQSVSPGALPAIQDPGKLPEEIPKPKLPKPRKPKFDELTGKKMHAFLATYAEGWKAKHGGNPEGIRDKAVIGKLGHWIQGVSEERACELVQVYLQIDYPPIKSSMHDLWQFFRHLNRIGHALDTGQASGSTNWDVIFGRAG